MDSDQILTATEASRGFSELLHRVCYGGESFVIKKGHRLMARIAPVEVPSSAETHDHSTVIQSTPMLQEQHSENDVDEVTADEAEFYCAWMEQVRKIDA